MKANTIYIDEAASLDEKQIDHINNLMKGNNPWPSVLARVWYNTWPWLILLAICVGLWLVLLNFFELAYDISTPLTETITKEVQ